MQLAKFVFMLLPALIGICLFAQNENGAPQDLKVVTTHQNISSGRSSVPSFSTTVYVHGPRIRHESASDPIDRANPIRDRATLYQCDLRRVLHLVLNEKLYLKVDLDRNGFPAGSKYLSVDELDAMLTKQQQAKAGGTLVKPPATVKIVTNYVDTGERKQIYGLTARHVRISRKVIALPGAQMQPSESDSDGWYVDLTLPRQCPTAHDAVY